MTEISMHASGFQSYSISLLNTFIYLSVQKDMLHVELSFNNTFRTKYLIDN